MCVRWLNDDCSFCVVVVGQIVALRRRGAAANTDPTEHDSINSETNPKPKPKPKPKPETKPKTNYTTLKNKQTNETENEKTKRTQARSNVEKGARDTRPIYLTPYKT